MEGMKHDQNKLRTDLIPIPALLGIAAVFTHGAREYGDWNWRKGLALSRLYGATLRHLLAFMMGEEIDPKSKLPHLDHALCEIIMLRENHRLYPEADDRIEVNAGGKGDGEETVRGVSAPAPDDIESIFEEMRELLRRDAERLERAVQEDLVKDAKQAQLKRIRDVVLEILSIKPGSVAFGSTPEDAEAIIRVQQKLYDRARKLFEELLGQAAKKLDDEIREDIHDLRRKK